MAAGSFPAFAVADAFSAVAFLAAFASISVCFSAPLSVFSPKPTSFNNQFIALDNLVNPSATESVAPTSLIMLAWALGIPSNTAVSIFLLTAICLSISSACLANNLSAASLPARPCLFCSSVTFACIPTKSFCANIPNFNMSEYSMLKPLNVPVCAAIFMSLANSPMAVPTFFIISTSVIFPSIRS